MQAVNQRTPEQIADLANKRKSALRQYIGASCIWQYCVQRGIHVTWELAEAMPSMEVAFNPKVGSKIYIIHILLSLMDAR